MRNPEIAKTILQQMRGMGRLKAMVGAYNFADEGNGVSFRFKGCKKINYIKVTLDLDDTYRIELGRIYSYNYNEVKCQKGIYADQLVEIFESETGLYLSL